LGIFNDATLHGMQRRTLLSVGIAAGMLLALAGGTLALLKPGSRDGVLTASGRSMFTAVAQAVLASTLPEDPAARAKALDGHLARVQATIAGMSPAMQAELDELITIVGSAPGRLALVGLRGDWSSASVAEVTAALQGMRESTLAVRQQAFHALRDLTNASYFADASTWQAVGYPGPRVL
jgi:hypothetical protein